MKKFVLYAIITMQTGLVFAHCPDLLNEKNFLQLIDQHSTGQRTVLKSESDLEICHQKIQNHYTCTYVVTEAFLDQNTMEELCTYLNSTLQGSVFEPRLAKGWIYSEVDPNSQYTPEATESCRLLEKQVRWNPEDVLDTLFTIKIYNGLNANKYNNASGDCR